MWKSTKSDAAPDADSEGALGFSAGLDPANDNYAVLVVDRILKAAVNAKATDVHFELSRTQTLLHWRVDGTLVDLGCVPNGRTTSILNRIKAMARLVTYRSDIPQEGRLALPEYQLEARVGTLPTLHGERVVIRLATGQKKRLKLKELGLDDETLARVIAAIDAASGVIMICGPAGAGKTTTAYACLGELALQSTAPRSLVTLEDPIEIEFPGIAQSQINPAVGYDWASGLKALLRQDPEVMFVGEIRDASTAAVVFEAAMTGQLVITTMHARSAADAIRRLLDMRIPPHHLLSGLNLLLCQRLLKAACRCQWQQVANQESAASCTDCGGRGYTGRFLLAESFPRVEMELARAIMADADSRQLEMLARAAGMDSLAEQATEAVSQQRTTNTEFRRHFTS